MDNTMTSNPQWNSSSCFTQRRSRFLYKYLSFMTFDFSAEVLLTWRSGKGQYLIVKRKPFAVGLCEICKVTLIFNLYNVTAVAHFIVTSVITNWCFIGVCVSWKVLIAMWKVNTLSRTHQNTFHCWCIQLTCVSTMQPSIHVLILAKKNERKSVSKKGENGKVCDSFSYLAFRLENFWEFNAISIQFNLCVTFQVICPCVTVCFCFVSHYCVLVLCVSSGLQQYFSFRSSDTGLLLSRQSTHKRKVFRTQKGNLNHCLALWRLMFEFLIECKYRKF